MKHMSLAISMLLFSCSVFAAEHGIVLNLGSKHFVSSDVELNETNLGLGYTNYINDAAAIQVGFYNNSFNDLSIYAGLKLYTTTIENVRPFFSIFVVSGYDNALLLLPIPTAGIDVEIIKTHKLNFMVAPLFVFSTSDTGNSQVDVAVLFSVQYEKLF